MGERTQRSKSASKHILYIFFCFRRIRRTYKRKWNARLWPIFSGIKNEHKQMTRTYTITRHHITHKWNSFRLHFVEKRSMHQNFLQQ